MRPHLPYDIRYRAWLEDFIRRLADNTEPYAARLAEEFLQAGLNEALEVEKKWGRQIGAASGAAVTLKFKLRDYVATYERPNARWKEALEELLIYVLEDEMRRRMALKKEPVEQTPSRDVATC